MSSNRNDLVGVGLYTVAEASRLSKVPATRIRRWLVGYKYRRGNELHELPPIWSSQIDRINSVECLGFLDLMEIRFVDAFRQHGVSLPLIRKAAERAYEIFERDHPFARKSFKTDGRRIFAEVLEQTGETKLIDLVRNQYAFHRLVSPSLYASLEFSERDDVLRWYPMWPRRQVMVDPDHMFGRPIVSDGRVPTEILAQAARAEESAERVARWFDVPVKSVYAAVEFERELAV